MIKKKQPILPFEFFDSDVELPSDVERYIEIDYTNEDKKVYGSKRINLLRIAQEKKIKKLQLAMCRCDDKTTEWDRINWRKDFHTILKWESHLSSGLNNTLSREEKKLANKLYRKYLGVC
jgi:hypothetical protein